MGTPDWNFWLSLKKVALWQAAYLSYGIDPNSDNGDNLKDIRRFGLSEENVAKRWLVLQSHFGTMYSAIPLSSVATLGVALKWKMPRKLRAIALKPGHAD